MLYSSQRPDLTFNACHFLFLQYAQSIVKYSSAGAPAVAYARAHTQFISGQGDPSPHAELLIPKHQLAITCDQDDAAPLFLCVTIPRLPYCVLFRAPRSLIADRAHTFPR